MLEEPRPAGVFPLRKNPNAELRLFCFHHAGGSAATFRPWVDFLPDYIELWAVQLPGRGERSMDPPLKRLPLILNDVAMGVVSHVDRAFAFFGHSMGAAVAFEIARLLRKLYDVQPAHIIASGCKAPQCLRYSNPSYLLPDDKFIERLKSLNGIPSVLLENPRMLEVVLPIIRADLEALQTYKYEPGAPLDCPITVMAGINDNLVNLAGLVGWKKQTTATCVTYLLSGGHFVFNTDRNAFLQIIIDALGSSATAGAANPTAKGKIVPSFTKARAGQG